MIGLQYILELEDMSRKQLAEKLGVTDATVSYWLNEKRLISDNMLTNIRQLFPFYPYSLFDKTIDERDRLTIENAKLKHEIELVQDDKSTEAMLKCIALRNRRVHNVQQLEKITITKKVEQIFDISAEHVLDKYLLMRRHMIDGFATYCEIELLMLQYAENPDPETKHQISDLIKMLFDELKGRYRML